MLMKYMYKKNNTAHFRIKREGDSQRWKQEDMKKDRHIFKDALEWIWYRKISLDLFALKDTMETEADHCWC